MKLIAILMLLLVSACDDRQGERLQAKAFLHWNDRISVALGLPYIGIGMPCQTKRIVEGETIIGSMPIDQCFRMTEPRRWRGVWVDVFEGSRFCEGARVDCPYSDHEVWLHADSLRPDHEGIGRKGDHYSIDFIGRRTLYPGSFGHMGMSEHEMIVDRLISIKRIDAPPEEVAAD